MFSFLQGVAVGLPLFFLVSDNPTARFFLMSSMVFLMFISVLLLLFIPKWRTLRMRQNRSAESGNGRVVISRIETSRIQSEDVSTIYGNNHLSAQVQYNENAWIEYVKNLELALEEAGIKPKPYF
jgi:competence protein ComGC